MKEKLNFNFEKKIVFLTGCNGYIGKTISKTLNNLDTILVLTDKQKKCSIKLKNKESFYIKCDLSNKQSTVELVKSIKTKLKKIDVIVNNASFTGDSNLESWASIFPDQNSNEWEKVFEVSVASIFEICRGLFPLIQKSTNGSIINISSIYGFMSPDLEIYKDTEIFNPAGYGVCKSGVIYLTKWLASVMAPKVRVNCISPGGISRNQSIKFKKNYINRVLLGRMCKEKDVLNAVLFLASDFSSYITGQNLILDGGYSIK